MVRGNWQRRVERTEARREASKAEKERRRSKRRSTSIGGDGDRESMYRILEEWLEDKGRILLDSYGGGAAGMTVDIWTDVRPKSREEYLPSSMIDESVANDDDEENGGGGRKARSKKDRGGFQNKKGKQHPNAKNKPEKVHANSVIPKQQTNDIKKLCSQEFYFGREKCPGVYMKQKRGGGRGRSNSIGEDDASCQYCHYHQFPKAKSKTSSQSSWVVSNGMPLTPPMTLAQVVNGKYMPHKSLNDEKQVIALPVHVREALLQWAFDAAMTTKNSDVNESSEDKMLDMIFHSRIYVQGDESDEENEYNIKSGASSADSESDKESHDDSEDGIDNIIQTLHELFEDEKIEPVNLIYLAIQGIIIYDINRGGLIYSDGTERYLLYGEAFHADFGKPHEDTNGECNQSLHEELTHHILDDILSFLDDESAGVLPQVCKSWRDEVGTRSPQLWKMLLTRRGWLWTVELDENNTLLDNSTNGDAEATRLYKEAFVGHYLAVRDVQAITNACTYLQNGGDGKAKQNDGIEYAVQSFKATKGSPDFDTNDIGRCTVKIWSLSNNPRALAGYGDCTLRLFEAVSSSTRMICRQVVCVRAAPPSISRKKNKCQLVSMDLDESVVASLINEVDDSLDIHGEVDGIDSRIIPWITVIPCEELVCAGNEGILGDESIHSFDVRASILDYIMGGNEKIADLRDEVHQYLSVVDSDTSDILVTVTPKIHACGKGNFVFHACVSIPGYSLLRYTDADGDSLQGDEEARLRSLESVVPPTSVDHLFVISTQRGGSVIHSMRLLHGCEDLFASSPFRRNDESGSTLITNVVTRGRRLQLHRLVLNRGGTFQDISYEVASDIDQNDCVYVTPTHVLYTRIGASRPLVFIQDIESRRIVLSMQIFSGASLQNIRLIHGQYVMIIFRSQAIQNEDDDDILGHWFGIDDISLKVFVYYIPTGHLMHKSQLPNLHITLDGKEDDVFAFNASTLGFGIAGASAREVAWKADDVDRLNEDSIMSPKNARGKKKRLAAKVAKKDKKDGFARGMSMRG